MRTLYYLVQKEFLQFLRNKTLLPIALLMPLIQMIILVQAATFELKQVRLFVVDKDLSVESRKLIQKFEASPFFDLTGSSFSSAEGDEMIKRWKTEVVIEIPQGFAHQLQTENKSEVQLLLNGINSMSSGIAEGYIRNIVADFNKTLRVDMKKGAAMVMFRQLDISYSFWYNPDLNYIIYMLPGLFTILVSMVGMFLSAIVIVREKEIGTIEQLNVTPIKRYQFVLGKMLPFLILSFIVFTICLLAGMLFYNLPMLGSFFTLYTFTLVYLVVALGMGLFMSAISNTQQQVMFVAWFFIFIFILTSGLFTPVESMPDWAQHMVVLNPMSYFIRGTRMIILKGAGFADIRYDMYALMVYGACMMSLAIWRYRKTA